MFPNHRRQSSKSFIYSRSVDEHVEEIGIDYDNVGALCESCRSHTTNRPREVVLRPHRVAIRRTITRPFILLHIASVPYVLPVARRSTVSEVVAPRKLPPRAGADSTYRGQCTVARQRSVQGPTGASPADPRTPWSLHGTQRRASVYWTTLSGRPIRRDNPPSSPPCRRFILPSGQRLRG